jgi:uncharacterized protein
LTTFNSIDLMLTRRCNLRCAFCYISQAGGKSETAAEEVARNLAAFAWCCRQFEAGHGGPAESRGGTPPRLHISLYGGEPCCAWESVVALCEAGRRTALTATFSLVTNMSLLDEARLEWCIANRVGIHPSIDGCAEAEDYFRRTADGQTVSAAVYRHTRALLARQPGRSCRSTIAPETAGLMYDSVRFLCEEIGFRTVNQVLAGGADWSEQAIQTVELQTRRITDWWIERMRAGQHYSLYYLRNMLDGIWTPLRCRRLCGAGRNMAAIDSDGNIYPCHRFCNASTPAEYRIGNIHNEAGNWLTNPGLLERLDRFDLAAEHKLRCQDCIAVNSCRALCVHEMMLAGRGMFEPCAHYCRIWPFYYREAMRAHAVLTAENNRLYLETYRPRCNGGHSEAESTRVAPGRDEG